MGMYGVLCRVSNAQLARIEADPERAGSLLTGRGRVRSKPWRLFELDKTWDAIDRGIRDKAGGPLSDVVHGGSGKKLGPSLSFGRPRYLAPERVAACAASLAAFADETFRERYIA